MIIHANGRKERRNHTIMRSFYSLLRDIKHIVGALLDCIGEVLTSRLCLLLRKSRRGLAYDKDPEISGM
jgi:hypothetical protein